MEENKVIEGNEKVEDKQEEPEKVELSKEEYEKQLNAEADRRVTKALNTAKEKWEAEFSEKLEKERREAERLAKLSQDEKEKELRAKQEQELEERERKLKYKELLSDTKDILHDERIPVKFAEILVQQDAESTKEKIDAFKREWQSAIEDAVNDRMRGTTPKRGEPKDELSMLQEKLANATKLQEKINLQRKIAELKNKE